MIEQSSIVVAVGVDEARREGQPMRVDDTIARIARPVTDGIDPTVDNSDLGRTCRRARAVDDLGIDDERCLRLSTRRGVDECKRGEDHYVTHETKGWRCAYSRRRTAFPELLVSID